MEHKEGLFASSLGLYVLAGFLCLASFLGCADNNIIPASKIAYGKVKLSWNNAPGVISYNIYFSGAAGVTRWNSTKISDAANPLAVTDLVPGKTYYFGITAVSESGESEILGEKSYAATDKDGFIDFGDLTLKAQILKSPEAGEQVPGAPVTLAWDDVPGAVSYNIYWSDSPGVTRQHGKKIANVTNPYTITGLKRGQTYYFVVTAVSRTEESSESEEISFSVK
jgi:fibronectin type 3 domain-containing protein